MEQKKGIHISELNINDKYTKTAHLTAKKVKQFAEATGDCNPIHLDEQYAATTPFKKPVVHGVLLLGFVSGIIGLEFPGAGTVAREISAKFVRPVFVGEKVKAEVIVTNKKEKINICYLDYIVYNEKSEVVVKGKVTILPPR